MNFNVQCFLTATIFYIPIRLFCTNRIPSTLFYIFMGTLFMISFLLPLLFYSSLALQRGVLYFYFLDRPADGVLTNPEKVGLLNTRNFYVRNGNITLGAWHILPNSYGQLQNRTDDEFEKSLGNGEPIILYIHGNMGSRASEHRLRLYQTLQSLDYHVITFDYRCFGDSTYGTPYEAVVVSDCLAVAKWLLPRIGPSPVFLWGHSLGAGMTTNIAAKLSKEGFECNGVILEAPFDDMPSEIRVHPFGKIFRIFPWYNTLFSQPYYTNGEDFLSSTYILQFEAPIMILHAEDDPVIPSELGLKLYRVGKHKRKSNSGEVTIHLFEARRKFGHTGISTAEELPEVIRSFVNEYQNVFFSK